MKTLNPKLFILVLGLALVACSGNTENTNIAANNGNSANAVATTNNAQNSAATTAYPQAVVDEFLSSCESAGSARTFCRCVLDKVESKYSLEEFSVIESKITAGEPPDEFVEFTGKARAECVKEE
jgi:hypothetical protein